MLLWHVSQGLMSLALSPPGRDGPDAFLAG